MRTAKIGPDLRLETRLLFYAEAITHQIGCGLKVLEKFSLPKIATVSIFL